MTVGEKSEGVAGEEEPASNMFSNSLIITNRMFNDSIYSYFSFFVYLKSWILKQQVLNINLC